MEDGSNLGHTITSQRTYNINGKLNFEKLYNKVKFLEETNKRFAASTTPSRTTSRNRRTTKNKTDKNDKSDDKKNAADDSKNKKNKGVTKEIQLTDTADVVFKHGQNTKRIIVRATTKNGKSYKLKYDNYQEPRYYGIACLCCCKA